MSFSALCRLPRGLAKTFYLSPLNDAFLAQLKGEDVVYSSEYYDKSGKPLENLETLQPDNPADVPLDPSDQPKEDPPGPKNKPDEEVAPVPNNTADDGSDDARSKEASGSDPGSDSNSSSGSGDSSQDSSSSTSSDGESDAKSEAPKRKVRWKKKQHRSSNAESDKESAPETTGKTGDQTDEEAKKNSYDSGLGDSTTANPTIGSSGNGLEALLIGRYAAGAGGVGSLLLPTTLPSMDTLLALTDDLEKYSEKMFQSLEETSIAVYNKVLQGFKDTSGKCKDFVQEMGGLVVTFFAQAEEMESGLAKCDALAFREAINASKNHVCGLMEDVADAESYYDVAEAKFDKIVASVAKEIKACIQLKGKEQRKEYKRQCLDQIRQDHGWLDGSCFIPMIVGNLTSHRALAMSQRVAQSLVPLKIMMVPLHTQAGAIKIYMKFIEFLAKCVIALQERLGPGLLMVPLELESSGFSTTRWERSSLPLTHSQACTSIQTQLSVFI